MFKKNDKDEITKKVTLTWEYRAFKITDRWRSDNPKTPICLEIDWQRRDEKTKEFQYITDTTYHKTFSEALAHLRSEIGECYKS